MWKKRGLAIVIVLLFFIPIFLSAQTAAELEAVLKAPSVSCARAAQFVAASIGSEAFAESGAESGAASASSQAAFEQALNLGWFPRGTAPDEPITLGKLSFLVMKAFDMKGGMMYALFPGPRYAFRAMVSRSFIQTTADPANKPSGETFLIILGAVLGARGED